MKTHMYIIAVALILAIASSSALATVKTWDTTTGNWNSSGNWSPSGIPDVDDEVKIRETNGHCTIPNGYTASCYRIYVYDNSTATLTIASGGTLVTDDNFFKTGFDNGQDGKTYQTGDVDLGTGDLIVGDGSSSYDTNTEGKYYQYGGTITAQDCYLAYRTGDGWIFHEGGLADYSGNMRVGYDHSVGRGRYELSGGTLDVAGWVNLGETSSCTGIFIMSGGSLGINGTLYVGGSGYGTMTVSGGDVDVAAVSVTDILDVDKGADWDAVGNMTIGASSTLQVDVEGTAAADHTGLDIDGNVTITAGATLEMYVGAYAPASGTEITIIKVEAGHSITGTFTNVTTGWTTVLKESNTELAVRCTQEPPPPAAFPGAEGEGKWATGGRGGDVYHVTNLNDDGAGSLRYGISSATGARTIVFDTGGTIRLTSGDIQLYYDDNITIAGQTAPGDGICIIGYGLHIRFSDDVIVRYLRIRPGDIAEGGFADDCINIEGSEDVIIDHCSTSWGIDECLSVFGAVDDVTVQWCIISEGLHCTGYHEYGPATCHSAGSLIRAKYQSGNVTFHHNYYAHQEYRSPRPGSYSGNTLGFDFRNNLIYNWGTNYAGSGCVQSTADGERVNMNYVGNYIVKGPESGGNYAFKGFDSNYMDIYQASNKIDNDRDSNKDGSNTGWSMFDGDYDDKVSAFTFEDVTTQSADDAATDILSGVGATVPSRDSVDARVLADCWDDDGSIIDSQDDVGGYPAYATGSAPTDTDQDGMPDSWETSYGTNPNVADNNGDLDSDGYTNLEEYLNSLCD